MASLTIRGTPAAGAGVKFLGDEGVVLSASSDGTARIWRAGEDGVLASAAVLKDHTAEVILALQSRNGKCPLCAESMQPSSRRPRLDHTLLANLRERSRADAGAMV